MKNKLGCSALNHLDLVDVMLRVGVPSATRMRTLVLDVLKWGRLYPGAPNGSFLLNTLKTLFRLSRVLLDL